MYRIGFFGMSPQSGCTTNALNAARFIAESGYPASVVEPANIASASLTSYIPKPETQGKKKKGQSEPDIAAPAERDGVYLCPLWEEGLYDLPDTEFQLWDYGTDISHIFDDDLDLIMLSARPEGYDRMLALTKSEKWNELKRKTYLFLAKCPQDTFDEYRELVMRTYRITYNNLSCPPQLSGRIADEMVKSGYVLQTAEQLIGEWETIPDKKNPKTPQRAPKLLEPKVPKDTVKTDEYGFPIPEDFPEEEEDEKGSEGKEPVKEDVDEKDPGKEDKPGKDKKEKGREERSGKLGGLFSSLFGKKNKDGGRVTLADTKQARDKEAEAARKAEEAERKRLEKEQEELRKEQEREKARQIAEEKEAKRKAAEEEAARELAEKEKHAAEERARREEQKKADAERRQREAEEKKAAEEERKRKLAEEAAAKKAADEEKKRLAAEEAARKKAEEEERKRIAAEEAAARKAEEEEKKRIAAEEAARKKAEEDERKRLEAEERARRKAEQERIKAEAAEEERKRKAEEKARKEEEKAAKRAAHEEEIARIKAESEERQRKAKEEQEAEARRRAELLEEKRQEEELRRIEDEARRAAEEAERAAEEERRKTEEALRQAEEDAERAAREAEEARKKAEQEELDEETKANIARTDEELKKLREDKLAREKALKERQRLEAQEKKKTEELRRQLAQEEQALEKARLEKLRIDAELEKNKKDAEFLMEQRKEIANKRLELLGITDEAKQENEEILKNNPELVPAQSGQKKGLFRSLLNKVTGVPDTYAESTSLVTVQKPIDSSTSKKASFIGHLSIFVTSLEHSASATHTASGIAAAFARTGIKSCICHPAGSPLPSSPLVTEDTSGTDDAYVSSRAVIYDRGTMLELNADQKKELKRADVKIMCCKGEDAGISALARFIHKEGEKAHEWIYVFNTLPKKRKKIVEGMLLDYDTLFLDAFDVDDIEPPMVKQIIEAVTAKSAEIGRKR